MKTADFPEIFLTLVVCNGLPFGDTDSRLCSLSFFNFRLHHIITYMLSRPLARGFPFSVRFVRVRVLRCVAGLPAYGRGIFKCLVF